MTRVREKGMRQRYDRTLTQAIVSAVHKSKPEAVKHDNDTVRVKSIATDEMGYLSDNMRELKGRGVLPRHLVILTKSVPWYGSRSGYYGMLPDALTQSGASIEVIRPGRSILRRLLGKCWSVTNGLPPRDQYIAEAEWRFIRRLRKSASRALMLGVEDNIHLLATVSKAVSSAARLTGVIHYPPAFWSEDMLVKLQKLSRALILYKSDIAFFEQYVGKGRVDFVPHGVDTDFFCPARHGVRCEQSPRVLIVGQFGRDFGLLLAVFKSLRERWPSLTLDIVGAHHARRFEAVTELATMDGVKIHATVTDEQLLGLYQSATLLILPLLECGANNALVEALACGVPVVATDVGGIRDYGGGEVFPVTRRGCSDSMAAVAANLLSDAGERERISTESRRFALRELRWSVAAAAHLRAMNTED